jgi:DNA-binding LacI/PurR family transcriptional regulator
VDLLKLLDLDSSLAARKDLAQELNVRAGADGSAEQNIALSKAVMQKLRESDVRGVAFVTSSVDRSMASELTTAGIPVVFCNSDPAGKLVGNICIEYEHGINKAIQHVVDLGHRRSAVIAGPADNRMAAYFRGEHHPQLALIPRKSQLHKVWITCG